MIEIKELGQALPEPKPRRKDGGRLSIGLSVLMLLTAISGYLLDLYPGWMIVAAFSLLFAAHSWIASLR